MTHETNLVSHFYWHNVNIDYPPCDETVIVTNEKVFKFVKSADPLFKGFWTDNLQIYPYNEYTLWARLPCIESAVVKFHEMRKK